MIDFISSSTGLLKKKNKTKSNAQAKGSSTPSTPDAHFYRQINAQANALPILSIYKNRAMLLFAKKRMNIFQHTQKTTFQENIKPF